MITGVHADTNLIKIKKPSRSSDQLALTLVFE